ncbi:FAD-dependent monooxygenase [Pseudonocardia thermophila]|jgi:2-polyprenyl-6-methoxyphenol hydroxylase and related FAD-dependent oxidoreductases|uniref:FAD-dependent monooxygenase n=1 Tax=Pseudonocardia thermophila TaxID=1848 RepID=UPI00248EB9B1|nr:FAD-dependent monooxygenase [Pseudonocardia thermophila]
MTAPAALISGAGIAGSAAAYWLRRAGCDVTVVERANVPRRGGQTVDLRGAGRTVARRMDVFDEIVARSVEQRGLAVVDDDGRVRASLQVDAFDGNGMVSEIEILRGDLADVLLAAAADDVEFVWGDSVVALTEHAGGVTVEFERSPARTFDLVIGADGTHSAVRAAAFGPETRFLRPLGGYQAWFTAPAAPELDGWYLMHRAPGGLVSSLRPGRLPGETKASLGFAGGPVDVDRRDGAAVRALLRERFAGVTGWKVPWLLDAADAAPDLVFDSIDQVRMDRWTIGRVALVGDAACSPSSLTGMGTCMAVVGAYVLAGELGRARHDHRAAFARYEEIMQPYVAQAQELPPGGMAGYAPRSRFGITLSTLSMRSMTRWPVRAIAARFFAKADAIDLPDYTADRAG